jgi:hypothetical protein
VSIALDPAQPAAARLAACREILDRGHGRPQQPVEHSGPPEAPGVLAVLPDNGRGPALAQD